MDSEELRMLQRRALAEVQQRAGSLTPSMAALSLQASQMGQLRADGSAVGGAPAEIIGEQYLIFALLEREFALKAEHIQGVERLIDVTPVPNVASWIQGVINLRGSIASVVDLRSFLGLERLPYNPRTRLLSVQYNEMVICLVVDGVSEMTPIPETSIASLNTRQTAVPPWAASYAAGSAVIGKRPVILLDVARLLFSDKMQRYEAIE